MAGQRDGVTYLGAASVEPEFVPGTLTDPAYVEACFAFNAYHERMVKTYKREPPRRKYQANVNWKSFVAIGRLCADNGWSAEDYVKTVMTKLRANHEKNTPKQISRSEGVYRTAIQTRSTQSELLTDYESYTRHLLMLCRDTDTTEYEVLFSAMTPFPAWYRIITVEPLTEAFMELWGSHARDQAIADMELCIFMRKIAGSRMTWLEDPHRWGPLTRGV